MQSSPRDTVRHKPQNGTTHVTDPLQTNARIVDKIYHLLMTSVLCVVPSVCVCVEGDVLTACGLQHREGEWSVGSQYLLTLEPFCQSNICSSDC